jgi:hypothetical protein
MAWKTTRDDRFKTGIRRTQMASWIVHLRVTDKLLDQIPDLSPVEFVIGNIAPDSGVPNEDWSAFFA